MCQTFGARKSRLEPARTELGSTWPISRVFSRGTPGLATDAMAWDSAGTVCKELVNEKQSSLSVCAGCCCQSNYNAKPCSKGCNFLPYSQCCICVQDAVWPLVCLICHLIVRSFGSNAVRRKKRPNRFPRLVRCRVAGSCHGGVALQYMFVLDYASTPSWPAY